MALVVRSGLDLGDLCDFGVSADGGMSDVHRVSGSDIVNAADVTCTANAKVHIVSVLQITRVEVVVAVDCGGR